MNAIMLRRLLAALAVTALAACGGGSGSSTVPAAPHNPGGGSGNGLLSRIVGVGDSLTAGFQADGFLGQTGVKDPFDSYITIHPGQENGFWAYLDEQASGLPTSQAVATMYDPAQSPLPLIAGPGINNQIVPGLQTPIGFEKPGNACADYHGFNAAGYLLNQSARVRMNPASTTIRNVAVPGITLHEANTLSQPQSTTCRQLSGIQGLLAQVVDGESSTFWPVLRNFSNMGSGLTMVNAAASLKPTLATVWLGANDVLKYMGSGGRFHGGDANSAQAASDVSAAVGALEHAGAKVVVADLPNILRTPYFMRVSQPKSYRRDCLNTPVQTYATCVFGTLIPFASPQTYEGITNHVAVQYHLSTPGGCEPASTAKPCGYLTLQGTLAVAQYWGAHNEKFPDLDNGVPGSGLGTYYITPAFAGRIQSLNDAVNLGIRNAAAQKRAPLVDVTAIFDGIASGKTSNRYYRQATSIGSGSTFCCTLAYWNGGLLSYDGLHPSNTGYALLAYAFIATINGAYGAKIPQIDIRAVYNGTRCSDKLQCYPDPYAPPYIYSPS